MMWEDEFYEFAGSVPGGKLTPHEQKQEWIRLLSEELVPKDNGGPRGARRCLVVIGNYIVDYDDVMPAFREASWDEALDLVARRLLEIREREGAGAGHAAASFRQVEQYTDAQAAAHVADAEELHGTRARGSRHAERGAEEAEVRDEHPASDGLRVRSVFLRPSDPLILAQT